VDAGGSLWIWEKTAFEKKYRAQSGTPYGTPPSSLAHLIPKSKCKEVGKEVNLPAAGEHNDVGLSSNSLARRT
jgi:hypothetical protein